METGLHLSPNSLGVKIGQGTRLMLAATPCTIHSRGQGMYLDNRVRDSCLKYRAWALGTPDFVCLADRRELFLPEWLLHAPASQSSQSVYPWMRTGSWADGICWTAESQEETAE